MANLPNIVLVHGAWADASSWSSVIRILQEAGHRVTAVQIPLTSHMDDVAVTERVLSMQNGPTLLVGHSYGGTVITEAASNSPNVIGLVYVAAFAPDKGENLTDLNKGYPPTAGISYLRPDQQGFVWLDPDGFPKAFAPDVDLAQARVLAAVQKPLAARCFDDRINQAAWHNLPSWFIVAENDRIISPELEDWMARRIGAAIEAIPSSHVAMLSHSGEVTNLIQAAARVKA